MDIILKSIIISLIATASVNLAYNFNNLGALAIINIIILVASLLILKKEKELKSSSKEENRKYLEGINEKSLIKFEDMINNLINKNEEFNESLKNQLSSSLKKEIENVSLILKDDLNQPLEKINNILNKIHMSHIDENNLLIKTIEEKNKEFIVKLDDVKANIIKNMVKELEVHNDSLKTINEIKSKLELEFKNINENEEKVIENLQDILEKEEESIDNLQSLIKRTKAVENNIDYLKDELIEKNEEIISSNSNVINEYKEIQGSMLYELNKLADKNEHIVKLLLDNYKVLNSLMEV